MCVDIPAIHDRQTFKAGSLSRALVFAALSSRFVASRGGRAAPFARTVCSSAPTTAPSPIAAPTRLTDPDRTSPAANTPRALVSSGSGRPDPLFDERASDGTADPRRIKFL